ncbi:hypothetical protein DASC09_055990 [Saccharomycopsis crataegensis]|uniref:Uncharacterized protein n=1 Tax=Saccharomycopsis crataegensis TaxID=43959 RepID=A0AAV5QTK7_9ASCO|nr:hypothetical protein DASC09_055990 [Saccharomycopsis crataegensis]
MLFNKFALSALLSSLVLADNQNKVILNDITIVTVTYTPGQPISTPTPAAATYSVYQTTKTVNGQVTTINPQIVQPITEYVTVTASAAASSSAAATSSSAAATTSSSAAIAATTSSSSSSSSSSTTPVISSTTSSTSSSSSSAPTTAASTHTVTVTDWVVETIYAVSTVYV